MDWDEPGTWPAAAGGAGVSYLLDLDIADALILRP
jgi:hypothetical protein